MIEALLIAVAPPAEPVAQAAAPDCSYDLEAMLKLDQKAFDQTLPDGGWRGLYKRGCYAEAAELIREWRHAKRDHASILYTHEGQMRAFAGQTDQAVALLRLTYKPLDEDAKFGWNFCMDGTIAFLERDQKGLNKAIERLKSVPKSEAEMVYADGTPVKMKWPPNLDVLEALERCWDRSFAEAYRNEECRRVEDRSLN
ncbi:MAG: hypothetical protein SXU28_10110 [Pseudomonadota bacterium]|nr:hypothetical protein [Pseudomonadota bacterium]